MAGQVHRHGPPALADRLAEPAPQAPGLGEPVREHERRALTDRLGVKRGHER
jgi:hypothetical protein